MLYKPLPRYLDDLAAFVLAITVLLSHPIMDWMSLSQKIWFSYRVIKAMASIYLECTSRSLPDKSFDSAILRLACDAWASPAARVSRRPW